MYKALVVCLVGIGALAPIPTHAAVVINEIAWMGTAVDSGSFCEWIELANTGTEAVSLAGWTLKTLDGGMTLALAGSIAPGAFYLIERSTPTACPDPVPGISADLSRTFGGGLSNAGEVLILASGTGEVERIDAATGWEKVVGGDSERKLTSQRSKEEWVTASSTPRAENATESLAVPMSSPSTSSSSSNKAVVTNPIPTIHIESGGDRIVSIKAHTFYHPVVYTSAGRHARNAQIFWAFGDGGMDVGSVAEHAYREPGEYLVVMRAEEGQSRGTTSFVVTALPADITITSLTPRGVGLTNNDTRVLDLSRYQLVSGRDRFSMPLDTQILPGRTVIFPPEVTDLSTTTSYMTLRYPSGEIASTYSSASSTSALQLQTAELSTTIVRASPIPASKVPVHEPAVEVPAQTAHSVGAGTLSAIRAFLAPLWPPGPDYRRLSILSP